MTQHRMLGNASFRLSGSDVTHDVSGEEVQGTSASAKGAERTFDRIVAGRSSVVLDADNGPM
jgi:hypothetical protein